MGSNQRALNSFYSMLDKEEEIVADAKMGNQEAFQRLYNHYIDPIYRFVALKVGSKEEAEDLTHEVFLSSWQNLNGYQKRGLPFSSWLYRIARNKVIDHYRLKKPTVDLQLVQDELVAPIVELEKTADVRIDMDRLKACLVKLSPTEQDVTIMRFIEELSHREIAEIMGKSEGAIRVIQHRAIANLKSLIFNAKEDKGAEI